MPVTTRPADAVLQHMFVLRIAGMDIAWWEKVSGLSDSSEVALGHAGGDASHAWKSPGKVVWNALECETVLSPNTEIRKWREIVRQWTDAGSVSTVSPKRDGKLTYYLPGGRKAGHWLIVGMWPQDYSGGEWDASATGFSKEKVKFEYDSYKWFEAT